MVQNLQQFYFHTKCLVMVYLLFQSITSIFKAHFTSAVAYTETQLKTPKSKQCRCRSTVAGENPLQRNLVRNIERNQALRGGLSSSGCARRGL